MWSANETTALFPYCCCWGQVTHKCRAFILNVGLLAKCSFSIRLESSSLSAWGEGMWEDPGMGMGHRWSVGHPARGEAAMLPLHSWAIERSNAWGKDLSAQYPLTKQWTEAMETINRISRQELTGSHGENNQWCQGSFSQTGRDFSDGHLERVITSVLMQGPQVRKLHLVLSYTNSQMWKVLFKRWRNWGTLHSGHVPCSVRARVQTYEIR